MAAPVRTVNFRKITLVAPAVGERIALSENSLYVTDFEVYVVAANTGAAAYIGDKTVDNTWIPRPKGVSYNFTHGTGAFLGRDPMLGFDLSRVFFSSDALGDQIIVQYLAGDKG